MELTMMLVIFSAFSVAGAAGWTRMQVICWEVTPESPHGGEGKVRQGRGSTDRRAFVNRLQL